MKIPISRNGIECGLLRQDLEKVAEADIRDAHGDKIERPKARSVQPHIYKETVEWMEGIADCDWPF
jgi:hypothetical protein